SGEALKTVIGLRRQQLGFSLDRLGEAVVSEKEARHYQIAYLKLIEDHASAIGRESRIPLLDQVDGGPGPGLYLSLKLSSLNSQIGAVNFQGSVEAISERLRAILLRARARKAFVCIDMEQYDYKAIVLETFKKLLMEDELRDWPDVGIAIQAYLKESERDVANLIQWAKHRGTSVTIRLVRGAYWDYETVIAKQHGWDVPVWTEKSATDWSYRQCLNLLLGHYPTVRTAVATHNIRSIAYAMALAEENNLRPDQFEFQMLYGMAPGLQHAIPASGYCLRVYVPFGEPVAGMAYLVRRLLENSSGQSLLIRNQPDALNATLGLAPPVPAGSSRDSGRERSIKNAGIRENAGLSLFVNESPHRFTDTREHQSMRSAIEELKRNLGEYYPVRINGDAIATKDFIASINPADPGEVIGRVGVADIQHADLAVAGANKAFQSWSVVPAKQRAAILIRTAGLLRDRRDRFAALEILEAAKTWSEADANITEAIDFLEFYAREAVRLASPDVFEAPGEYNLYGYSPLGVGVVIPPWNFPLAILTGMLSAALVTGNAVILKPSSQTPVIAARFVDLLREAGLPAGVVQFLPGPGSTVGQYLVDHPDTHFVAFTGSETVGTALIESASRKRSGQTHVKRIIAEMGGKNAIIVDGDAELDDAVGGIVRSAFGYQGQKCSACSRLIVIGNQYRALLARLVDAAGSLKIGKPENPSVNFGPVIESAAMERIRRAIREGQRIAKLELAMDCPVENGGYFVPPAIFSDVPPDSGLFREEIFGPVLSVVQADCLDQALNLANDCVYALTGGFYSRSPTNIERVKREFQVGNLYINRGITGALVSRQPFGGFKMSGVGTKTGGRYYLAQFMNQRTLTENTVRRGFAPISGAD
ncbi:MAG: bifunctional proline dehydrogenase/L-glutamate gamma-semialdehyde dehydrogenase, partial [Methylococcaceae bacterium]|nr:bifunctional proline dehydrogenase/L-glutamate gamma-semialdehyde dehydrogenase [Methylococcaceae bacterium]